MKANKKYLGLFAAAAILPLSACNVAYDISTLVNEQDLEEMGTLTCENEKTGGKISFEARGSKIWTGTGGMAIEFYEQTTKKDMRIIQTVEELKTLRSEGIRP